MARVTVYDYVGEPLRVQVCAVNPTPNPFPSLRRAGVRGKLVRQRPRLLEGSVGDMEQTTEDKSNNRLSSPPADDSDNCRDQATIIFRAIQSIKRAFEQKPAVNQKRDADDDKNREQANYQ